MNKEHLEASLESIRYLLSHLHGEVTALEASYSQVLLVLQKFESVCDIDDLTGLLRRNAFFSQWQKLLKECEQLNESTGVLMIDIDHFKRINDTFGHPTGDQVIQAVAALLKQYESPGRCAVGRFGGEEFAVAIRGTEAEILGIAEFIRRGAENLHRNTNGAEWKCTLSVGVASAQKVGFDASRLLKEADTALYAAKQQGRNQVRQAS